MATTPITSLTHGHIDRFGPTADGCATISGWIFRELEALDRVDITLDQKPWQQDLGLFDRPDVPAAYESFLGFRPHITKSGFNLTKPLPSGVTNLARTRIEIAPYTSSGQRLDPFISYFRSTDDQTASSSLPPVELQERVGGSHNFSVISAGLTSLIITQMQKYKPDFLSSRILDWGCGCGRVISQLLKFVPPDRLYGCDIDTEAIRWNHQNLRGPTFTRIDPYPPTKYASHFFDSIYGISVMTHLSEETQLLWLRELKRISAPGAVLALSVIGRNLRQTNMPVSLADGFKTRGFASWIPAYSQMLDEFSHPEYYQESYHSLEYIENTWGKYFQVLEYAEAGHQDIVLLRNS
jgi:2-polyprenyl-3-methyl-5-hydroxy-6-metoxy-1,4-benzoquinol methylase